MRGQIPPSPIHAPPTHPMVPERNKSGCKIGWIIAFGILILILGIIIMFKVGRKSESSESTKKSDKTDIVDKHFQEEDAIDANRNETLEMEQRIQNKDITIREKSAHLKQINQQTKDLERRQNELSEQIQREISSMPPEKRAWLRAKLTKVLRERQGRA